MISEEKVKIMAEMAKYEKNYGKGDFRIYKYTKKDYVRSEKIKTSIALLISLLTRYPPMNMQIRYTTPPARIEIFHPCAAPRLRIAVTSAVTRQNTTKYKSRSLLSIALAAIRL